MMDKEFNILEGGKVNGFSVGGYKLPISTILIGREGRASVQVGVDKKFNWFQKKMIKWCFGFEVKENKRDE